MTKSKSSTSFAALVIAFAVCLFTTPAHAADVAATAATVQVSGLSPQVSPTPWYQSVLTGENIAWVFGVISGIVAIFKNKALTTSQKSLRAVIVGVEQATKLPAVQAEAAKIKATIQNYAVSHGIQNELDTLVQDITSQLAPTAVAVPADPAKTAAPAV